MPTPTASPLPPLRCVLLDLDGVVRHFDPDRLAVIEADAGLDPGAVLTTAFSPDLYDPLVTGRLSKADWVSEVGRRLGAPAVAAAWTSEIGQPDLAVLALADEVRSLGVTVAILTNGTDTVHAELAALGIDAHVDAVFNSADMGVAKPDEAAFRHVCDNLAVAPNEVFFTDDSPSKLGGAISLGMRAEPFVGLAALRPHLIEAGLPLSPEPTLEPSHEPAPRSTPDRTGGGAEG